MRFLAKFLKSNRFRYLSTEHTDILLTDIRLPNISGLDLVRMLRGKKIRSKW
ncbi:response regulator [Lachnospiraceae bacterium]|nr:response regulator [Lachnospiraceae bacterium]